MNRDALESALTTLSEWLWETNARWHHTADGQWIQPNVGEKIALIHAELSEALEADRKSLQDSHLPFRPGIEVELADAVIRIFDLAKALKLDLPSAIIEKNNYNAARLDHTHEARAGKNGKKY